jgi:tripartite-type tricarboxylate transporter receptor subunit TctC
LRIEIIEDGGVMDWKACGIFLIMLLGLIPAIQGLAQEPFYKGKTVRIIVGFSAGGGYDTYSRAIARHIGKHIPGNPSIVVQNMTGAGSLIAANHVGVAAGSDGLTIGHFIGGLFLQQLLGKPGIEFDSRKFEFLGVPVQDSTIFLLSKASGITRIEEWMATKAPVKLGGVGPGSATEDIPKVLQATIGLPVRIVSGYKGVADIRLAVSGGEVAGVAGSWETFKLIWRKELQAGEVSVVLQAVPKPHPDLPRFPWQLNSPTMLQPES